MFKVQNNNSKNNNNKNNKKQMPQQPKKNRKSQLRILILENCSWKVKKKIRNSQINKSERVRPALQEMQKRVHSSC